MSEPDYSVIGNRIKKARINKKYTQQDLSDKMGISPAYVSKVEKGKNHFNVKRLAQASQLLEVPEGYFLDGTSIDSKNYLDKDLYNLIKKCSPRDQKIIYDIVKIFAKSENNSEKTN